MQLKIYTEKDKQFFPDHLPFESVLTYSAILDYFTRFWSHS